MIGEKNGDRESPSKGNAQVAMRWRMRDALRFAMCSGKVTVSPDMLAEALASNRLSQCTIQLAIWDLQDIF